MAIWDRGLRMGLHFDEQLIALGDIVRRARGPEHTFVAGTDPAPAAGVRVPDNVHLQFCRSHDLVLVTVDGAIRRETIRASERAALDQVRVIVFKTENLTRWGQVLVFTRAWERICDRYDSDATPWTVALNRAEHSYPSSRCGWRPSADRAS